MDRTQLEDQIYEQLSIERQARRKKQLLQGELKKVLVSELNNSYRREVSLLDVLPELPIGTLKSIVYKREQLVNEKKLMEPVD